MIEINSRFEYDLCKIKGFEPLIDWRRFKLNIRLRIALQRELFGSASFQLENSKYYKWVYERSYPYCQETGQPIHACHAINRRNIYSAENVSHIISKGADRRMATDPRNANILIKEMHDMWEFGTIKQKMRMNIYSMNKIIIKLLKEDYRGI